MSYIIDWLLGLLADRHRLISIYETVNFRSAGLLSNESGRIFFSSRWTRYGLAFLQKIQKMHYESCQRQASACKFPTTEKFTQKKNVESCSRYCLLGCCSVLYDRHNSTFTGRKHGATGLSRPCYGAAYRLNRGDYRARWEAIWALRNPAFVYHQRYRRPPLYISCPFPGCGDSPPAEAGPTKTGTICHRKTRSGSNWGCIENCDQEARNFFAAA